MSGKLIIIGALLRGLVPLVLVACASSGGGGDGGDGFVDTSQPTALNAENATAVSGLVVEAALGGVRLGSLGTVAFEKAEDPETDGAGLNLIRLTRTVMDRFLSIRGKAAVAPPALQTSVDCTGDGMVEVNWMEEDFAELSFLNCDEQGLTLNGPMTVGILSLAGNPQTDPSWMAVLRLNFEELTASSGGFAVAVFGTLDMTVDAHASGTVVTDLTTELAGGTASSALHFDEEEDDFTELSEYSVRFQENIDGSFSLSGQGMVQSTYIAGIVTFQTTQDLAGAGFDANNPSSGRVLIVGAGNSSVLVRVLDSLLIRMDVDDEGDGFDGSDTTIDSSWEEIFAASDAL